MPKARNWNDVHADAIARGVVTKEGIADAHRYQETPIERYYDAGDIDLDEEVVLDHHGNRITEARAEEMAEDALRKVCVGRPSLTGGATHSPQVAFRVPEQLRGKAEQLAEQGGVSISALARWALEQYVEQADTGSESTWSTR